MTHGRLDGTLRRVWWLGVAAAAVQLVVLIVWSAHLWARFDLTTDFATFSQAWNLIGTGHLDPVETTFAYGYPHYGYPFWQSHFELVLWPLALLRTIGLSAFSLLVVQDLALAATTAAAVRFGLELLGTYWRGPDRVRTGIAVGLVAAAVVTPWTYWAASFDFHLQPLALCFTVLCARDLWAGAGSGALMLGGYWFQAEGLRFTSAGSSSTFGVLNGTVGNGMSLVGSSGSATFTGNTRLNESIVTNAGFNNQGTVTNNGTLQLANAQTIYGYLNQAAGSTLDLMFAGNSAGQYGNLTSTQSAVLAGTLALETTGAFSFSYGHTYDIMDFSSRTGDFSAFSLNGTACTSQGTDVWNCGGGLLFTEVFSANGHQLNLVTSASTIIAAIIGALLPKRDLVIKYLTPWSFFVVTPTVIIAHFPSHFSFDGTVNAYLIARVIGKVVGISVVAWLVTRKEMIGVGLLCGMGMTVSVVIAEISTEGAELESINTGIYLASIISGALGYLWLRIKTT